VLGGMSNSVVGRFVNGAARDCRLDHLRLVVGWEELMMQIIRRMVGPCRLSRGCGLCVLRWLRSEVIRRSAAHGAI
jgi:hypothetical protein